MQSDACINFAERLLYRYNQFCNMKQSKAEKFVYLCRQQKLKHMNYPLNYYASRNPLNTIIAENMVDLTMLEEEDSSFEYKACLCFSNAYLICQKMIKESPIQLWSFPDYCSKANYGSQDKDFNKIIKAVTLTIVYILTDHFDEKWKSENQKILKKIKDYILKLYVSGETLNLPGGPEIIKPFASKTVCATVFDNLRRGTDIDYVIPFDDILYLGTRIVDNNHLESDKYITRDEVEKIISQHFKNINEQKKEEIDEEEEITNEDILKAWEQAMVNAKAEIESKIPSFEYDKKNEGLKIITGSDNHNNGKNESLEEIIKTTVKKYLDEETEVSDADIDEIFANVYGKDLVDKVNREMSAANNVEESNEETNQLPISNTDDILQQQLTGAQKTIEEQAHTIDGLQAEIENMRTTLAGSTDMDVDYDDVNKWAKVIFFATVLKAAYQKRFTVGQQLAQFICLICGGKPSTYQPLISKIASMEDNEKDNSGDSYSPQVIKAAKAIVERLVEIPEGNDVHPTIQSFIDSICDEFSIEKPKKKER